MTERQGAPRETRRMFNAGRQVAVGQVRTAQPFFAKAMEDWLVRPYLWWVSLEGGSGQPFQTTRLGFGW